MSWFWWLIIGIAVAILVIMVILYFIGRSAEKKKAQQDKVIAEASQTVSLLIDKKKMKLKDAGLPPAVMSQTPWYLKGTKAPVVKVKIGPKVMTLLCAPEIFDSVPVKKEVKAVVSGLYLTAVKNTHGTLPQPEQKKSWFKKLKNKAGIA